MPIISLSTTPYGVRKNFVEVPFAAQVGANDIPVFVLAFKPGEIPTDTAALTVEDSSTQRVLTIPAQAGTKAVGKNEYAGKFVRYTKAVGGAVEYAEIEANDAVTADGNALGVTLKADLTLATDDDADTAEILDFAGFKDAQFHTDLDSALATYFTYNSTEQRYNGENHDAVAYDQLTLYAQNGGGPFWVLAAEWDADATELKNALKDTTGSQVTASLRAITNAGKICCPKGYTGLVNADYAEIDGAWIDYCDTRATSAAEDLREHVYVMGAFDSTSAAAATYISSTLNKTSERHAVLWPRVKFSRQDGIGYYVDCAGLYAAMPTRVHALAQEGVGHAIAGPRLTQVAGITELEVNPTRAERPANLQANNINYMVSEPGVGTYILGSQTGNKTETSPTSNWHVVETRNFLWDGLQTIAKAYVYEPNSPEVRSKITSLSEQFLEQQVGVSLNDFEVEDKTTANDVSNGLIKVKVHALMPGVAKWIEFTVVSEIGESFS